MTHKYNTHTNTSREGPGGKGTEGDGTIKKILVEPLKLNFGGDLGLEVHKLDYHGEKIDLTDESNSGSETGVSNISSNGEYVS